MSSSKDLSRRDFLKTAGWVAGAAALAPSLLNAAEPAKKNDVPPSGPVPMRTLGKSGLKISAVSVGTGGGQDPKIIQYAIKRGINFFHTATGYAKGAAIQNLGLGIKGKRNKAVIGLKITWGLKNDKEMDAALETLGTDYADIAFFNIHSAAEVKDPKYHEAAERWIKMGKFKHIGMTTHSEMKGCMEEALKQGFYEALMPSYNLTMEAECRPVFEEAARQNVGIILMKTQHKLDDDAYSKAIPQLLATPGVTTINKSLGSFANIDAAITHARAKATAQDADEIRKTSRIALTGHCAMCGACTAACPKGMPVADLVRCSDYYLSSSAYHGMARDVFASLENRGTPADCANCRLCEQACNQQVPIRHHLNRSYTLLA